jgi:hypothetical protein
MENPARLRLSDRIEQHLTAIENEIKEAGFKPALITLSVPLDLYKLLIDEFTNKYNGPHGSEEIHEFTLYGKFVFAKKDE